MKSLIHRSATPLGAIFAALFLLFVVIAIMVAGRVSATNGQQQAGRLVTIHDRGTEKVILTDAATIGDALKEAGIELDENDAVEPAQNEKLVSNEYNVNIYRARAVIIVDGVLIKKVITPYQTAEQIARSAGVKLYPEDRTTLTSSNDIIADGAGLKLTIDRATPVSFTLYGKTTQIRTQGLTVGDMLKEKGITLGKDDRAAPSLSTTITSGLSIRLWREGKQTITVDEAIPFDTEKIQDGDRPVGYTAVQTTGRAGSRNVTYEVTVRDGKEVGRTEIASITTSEPQKQIEIVGVKTPLVPYTGTGTKTEWLIAAGIPESDWGYVDYIITRESGWNPNSVNNTSGACGLAQALPCSKVPGNPLNPIDSLKWANGYAHTCVSYRMYCGWEGAYRFWLGHNWW